jgi:hypothetical protein
MVGKGDERHRLQACNANIVKTGAVYAFAQLVVMAFGIYYVRHLLFVHMSTCHLLQLPMCSANLYASKPTFKDGTKTTFKYGTKIRTSNYVPGFTWQ